MATPLRVLVIEDDEDDALLVVRELRRCGYEVAWRRVETRERTQAALEGEPWDVIISDFRMPRFSAPDALQLCRERGLDLPFIIVSGTIDEEQAVESLRAGAGDFLVKTKLARLGPAVARELREAESRRARGRAEQEKRAAEEDLQRQREKLLQAEKLAAMGELLAGVAHELNNPLSVVTGQAWLLRRALDEGPEARRVEKICEAAERCARIVRNFLALARQQPPERSATDLNALLEETLSLLDYRLKVDGIDVRLDPGRDLPIVWADMHQLKQVLVNLLTNAHQALRTVAPPRRITLASRSLHDPERVVVEVADNGPGIPPDIRERIFEPFFTTKPRGQGTGLGLSLCQGIVASHGGSVTVESEPGRGAAFRVELPVEEPPATPGPSRAPVPAKDRAPGSILIVDDEPQVGALLADLLGGEGHRVETAENGIAALEKLEGHDYDVVVSDLRMPGLDGPGLYREVSRRHPGLEKRFVFLTGDTLLPGTREFLEGAGAPHLAKPFDLDEALRVVENALAERRGGSEP